MPLLRRAGPPAGGASPFGDRSVQPALHLLHAPRGVCGPRVPGAGPAADVRRDRAAGAHLCRPGGAQDQTDRRRAAGVRPEIADLVRRLAVLPIELALSTNALLLRGQAAALRKAGLRRLNISLDAIDDAVFGEMNGLGVAATNVLAGIDEAQARGFAIKLNMVVQRGGERGAGAADGAPFRGGGKIPLRFIEFMDVGNSNRWGARAGFFPARTSWSCCAASSTWPRSPGPAAAHGAELPLHAHGARSSASSTRSPRPFAATATGCGFPPTASSSPVSSPGRGTISASSCARRRAGGGNRGDDPCGLDGAR